MIRVEALSILDPFWEYGKAVVRCDNCLKEVVGEDKREVYIKGLSKFYYVKKENERAKIFCKECLEKLKEMAK
jgi:hypothetical protein